MIPTDFSNLIGNERVKSYLTCMIKQKRIGHSLLFAGPDGIGKSLFATALASLLIADGDCSERHRRKIEIGCHPDLHIYRPEGKLGLHPIQAMRQFSEEVYLPAYESKWKAFIIHEADRMLSYSANALLKTFEEPPPFTLIILLSSAPSSLLPTIASRCRALHFQSLSKENIQAILEKKLGIDSAISEMAAEIAQGSLTRAIHAVEKKADPIRSNLLSLLSKESAGTYKALSQAAQVLVDEIESIKKDIEEATKGERQKGFVEHLSSQQQHVLEKELEGKVATSLTTEVNRLLESILSWYRDLHLLKLNGELRYLINKDHQILLEQVLQRGNLPSLEEVSQAIDEMRLAVQRSTSLQICLENIFLKLNLL